MLPIAKTFRAISSSFDGADVKLPRQFGTPDSILAGNQLRTDQPSRQRAGPETPVQVHDKRKPSQRNQRNQELETSWRGYLITGNRRSIPMLLTTIVLANSVICSAGNTKVATIQRAIIEEFEQISHMVWLGLAYVLAYAIALPIWNRACTTCSVDTAIVLYVVHGLVYAISDGLFGLAGNMNELLVGRVIVAIGSSGMHTGAGVMASNLRSRSRLPSRRIPYLEGFALPVARAFGLWIGSVGGFIIASGSISWRWAFYFTAILSGFLTVLFVILVLIVTARQDFVFGPIAISLHSLQSDIESLLKWNQNVDNWRSCLLYIGSLCVFTAALTFGGSRYAWNSRIEIALWGVAGFLATAAVYSSIVEREISQWLKAGLLTLKASILGRTVQHRSEAVHLPYNLDSTILQGISFAGTGVFIVSIYYIPIFFQFTGGMSASRASSLVVLLNSIAFVTFIFILVFDLLGLHRPLDSAIVDLALVNGGVPLLTSVSNFDYGDQIWPPILLGAGFGLLYISRSVFSRHLKLTQDYLPSSARFHPSIPSESLPPLPPSPPSLEDNQGTRHVLEAIIISQGLGAVIALAAAATIYQNFSIHAVQPLLSDSRFRPYFANMSSAGNDSNSSAVAFGFIVGNSSKGFDALPAEFQRALLDVLTSAFRKVWYLLVALAAAAACLTVGLLTRVLLLRFEKETPFLRRWIPLVKRMQWSDELKAMVSVKKKKKKGTGTGRQRWGSPIPMRREDSNLLEDIELADIPR